MAFKRYNMWPNKQTRIYSDMYWRTQWDRFVDLFSTFGESSNFPNLVPSSWEPGFISNHWYHYKRKKKKRKSVICITCKKHASKISRAVSMHNTLFERAQKAINEVELGLQISILVKQEQITSRVLMTMCHLWDKIRYMDRQMALPL